VVCSSGVAFDPTIDGTTYTFAPSGLYNGLFVMRDDQTGSIWTHFDGSVIQGPMAGTGAELEIQPIVHVTWSDWLEEHPDTLVPDWFTGFENRYAEGFDAGSGGLSPTFQDTLLNEDDRLPVNELVLGVGLGDEYTAFVLGDIGGPVVANAALSGFPLAVFLDGSEDFGLAFCAAVNGHTLSFEVIDGQYMSIDGTVWSRSGLATEGPLEGEQLGYVTSFVTEWYGWSAYHPATTISVS
jgi:hypothetical protein